MAASALGLPRLPLVSTTLASTQFISLNPFQALSLTTIPLII
jgi:hypothetical protein